MKNILKLILIVFLLFFSCAPEQKIDKSKKEKKIRTVKKSKSRGLKLITSKSLIIWDTEKLLEEYEKNPEDFLVKEKLCEYLLQAISHLKNENDLERASKYEKKREKICLEEAPEQIASREEKFQEEKIEGLHLSLSKFDVQISGLSQAPQADKVLMIMDNAFMKICGELAATPEDKIKVILYTDREFYDLTKVPPWIGGFYDGKIHLPIANSDPNSQFFERVVVHELVHAILSNISNNQCPRWLHEGLAQYFEGASIENYKALSRSLDLAELQPLDSYYFLSGNSPYIDIEYELSLLAVEYLLTRSSMATISQFLSKLSIGVPENKAFYDTFLLPYREFDKTVREYLNSKK